MRGVWGFFLFLFVSFVVVADECALDLKTFFEGSELYSPGPVLLSVAVIIHRDGKVLMNKRRSGYWAFAGGGYESCDINIEACARREVLEEVGVTLKNLKYKLLQKIYVEERKQMVVVAIVTAEIESGEPQLKEPTKSSEWSWYSWDNLPTPHFPPNQKLIDEGFNPFK